MRSPVQHRGVAQSNTAPALLGFAFCFVFMHKVVVGVVCVGSGGGAAAVFARYSLYCGGGQGLVTLNCHFLGSVSSGSLKAAMRFMPLAWDCL